MSFKSRFLIFLYFYCIVFNNNKKVLIYHSCVLVVKWCRSISARLKYRLRVKIAYLLALRIQLNRGKGALVNKTFSWKGEGAFMMTSLKCSKQYSAKFVHTYEHNSYGSIQINGFQVESLNFDIAPTGAVFIFVFKQHLGGYLIGAFLLVDRMIT